MSGAVKIAVMVAVLVVVLLLVYYFVPDGTGQTAAQKKTYTVVPAKSSYQPQKAGLDVGMLISGILGILQAAGKFIADAVKGAKSKAKTNTKSESDPYGGKYDPLDKLNVSEMFNQSLNENSPLGGYIQGDNYFSFGDLFGGGTEKTGSVDASGGHWGNEWNPEWGPEPT